MYYFLFFFSSRRRHTRCGRDWSSDVCSSDLIGETPDVENRLIQHNTHYFKTNFSKSANDWKLLLKYPCENRKESLFLERFLKRMKSRKFLQKVIAYPEILSDILNKK